MHIEIIKPGLATSVQDLGRIGFGSFGVPKSGVMDTYAAKFANMLVGNEANDAVLEITQLGPKLRFHGKALVAIAGRGEKIEVDGIEKAINESFLIQNNAILEIKRITAGSRVYLAVAGGIQSPMVMESRSMYEGITSQSRLKKGDFLQMNAFSGEEIDQFATIHFDDTPYFSDRIQFFPGPEFHLISSKMKRALWQTKFTVSNDSNRMAYLFEESIKNELGTMLTGPVLPGTVQLTPDGNLIVLMRDCQVTGGYPRILQVTEKSMNVLAQKRAGEQVVFEQHF